MTDLSCTFEDAEINHLRDALGLTTTARWQWLQQAMEFGASLARSRAKSGLSTFDCHGMLLWSPLHERVWTSEQRPPSGFELDALVAMKTETGRSNDLDDIAVLRQIALETGQALT